MRKLLLCCDVDSLGRIGDIVEVKDGYARNYLIPSGMAVQPTETNLKRIEEQRKIVEAQRAKELEELRKQAEKLEGTEVTLVCRANEQGHLFGSVGPKEIAAALAEEGYEINPQCIQLTEHFKAVDKYTVPVRLAEEAQANITVWVAPDKKAQEAEQQEEQVEPSMTEPAEENG